MEEIEIADEERYKRPEIDMIIINFVINFNISFLESVLNPS